MGKLRHGRGRDRVSSPAWGGPDAGTWPHTQLSPSPRVRPTHRVLGTDRCHYKKTGLYCFHVKGQVFAGWGAMSPEGREEALLAGDERVPQDHDDRVPAQEHLGDVAVLVDWLGLLLALATLGDLGPHLLHIL